MVPILLVVTLLLTTGHVSGVPNATESDGLLEGKRNPGCPFKPEICKSDVSAINNCITIDSTLHMKPTDGFWQMFEKRVNEGVREAIETRCELCDKYNGGGRGSYGAQKPSEATASV